VHVSAIDAFLWWTAFININLAAVNALPVAGLDGGQMLAAIKEHAQDAISTSNRVVKHTTRVVSVVIIVCFAAILFAPHL